MEFLTLSISSLPPIRNHPDTLKSTSKITSVLTKNSLQTHLSFHCKTPFSIRESFQIHFEISSFLKIPLSRVSKCLQNHILDRQTSSFHKILPPQLLKLQVSFAVMAASLPFPPFAATETVIEPNQTSGKINIESILISIDNFFNRYPFFVASVTFVWFVVVPVIHDYLKKVKYTSAFNAFRRLKENPNAQLLDIRNKQSLMYLGSPNLKILKKSSVQVEFSEGKEDDFVKEVLKSFSDPANTTVCILDNFDGKSLKVAELLFKSGFKEAYAITGGLRGKDGWREIQENLLPPSVHVYPRKKQRKASQKLDVKRERLNQQKCDNGQTPSSTAIHKDGNKNVENGYIKPKEITPRANQNSGRPLSPYPNYPDMKPPSSPTPSKPVKGSCNPFES